MQQDRRMLVQLSCHGSHAASALRGAETPAHSSSVLMQAKRMSRQNYSHNERQLENIKWAPASPLHCMASPFF